MTAATLHGVAAGGSEVIKPELGCEADQVVVRDARRPAALGEACREDAEGLGLHRDEGSARRVLSQGEGCGDHSHVDDFLVVGEEEHLL